MTTFETILLILLVINAVTLAGFVLLQQGKGADIGAAFGSGSANTLFGGRGSTTFLTKSTAWLSIGFFLISFVLAYTAKERAEALKDLGIPMVEQTEGMPQVAEEPVGAAELPAANPDEPVAPGGELTAPEEKVESDIPDL